VNASAGREAVVLAGSVLDPRPAYAAADVVLAMGGSALRGLAHGKPVVVLGEHGFARTFGPDSLEYFLDAGFFGQDPVDDPVGHLAGLLRGLLAADRDVLGEYGRAAVEDRFGLEAAATSLEKMYAAALASPPGLAARTYDAAYLLIRHTAHDARLRLRRLLGGGR
jgi:glycosyltransferase involved in cell wall biosynthesis